MSYLYNQVKAYRDVYGPAAITNGVLTTSADTLSWYYTFTGTGTFTPLFSFDATVLVVGGGGAGGGRIGGGGGGGGVVTQNVTFTSGTPYAVTPGLGGTGAYLLSTNGSASSITYNGGTNTLVSALGGGHGAVFWRDATGAVFNGSISGTALTSTSTPNPIAGAIGIGQTLYHASIPAGVTITLGGGTSWTVSQSVGPTGTLTAIYSTLAAYAAAGTTAGLVGSGGGGTLGHDTAPGQFQIAGLGTSGQGNAGGNPGSSRTQYGAGGGGGASAVGGAASGNSGGAGGAGYTAFNSSTYGGGGGGCSDTNGAGGAGGSGGGGSGIGTAGSPNTGGGGGGFRNASDATGLFGGNGGSGVIIIKVVK